MSKDKPNIQPNGEMPNNQGVPEDLKFNEELDSYELDRESEDPEYQHEDPYDSAAPEGEDDNSDWDEANPLVGDEYDENKSLETDAESLGMHIDSSQHMTNLSKKDGELAQTPEDNRDDLDAEGYPVNDRK